MPSFEQLPEGVFVDRELAVQRELGVLAEEAEDPLLGLVYIRQIYDRRNAFDMKNFRFDQEWHSVVHARGRWGVPEEALGKDRQRRAFSAAVRHAFRVVAGDFGVDDDRWSRRRRLAKNSEEEAFVQVLDALVDLDLAVNRRRLETGPRSVDADVAALRKLARRAERMVALEESRKRQLRILVASIARAIENHSAGAAPDELAAFHCPDEVLTAALASPGADQMCAIELINRRAVHMTNTLAFDDAWEQLEETRQRFVGETALRDETIGALLGTLGQCYGLMGTRDHDEAFLLQALETFEAARRHFEHPPDLLRQDVYRIHALVGLTRLGREKKALREALEQLEPVLSDTSIGRRDYLVGAYLKGWDALGEQAPGLSACGEALAASVPNVEQIDQDLMVHGALCASGWLSLTKNPPRRALGVLERVAQRPGLLGIIAKLFLAEGAIRAGKFDEASRASLLEGCGSAPLERILAPAIQTPGSRVLHLIPFNFA